MKFFTRCNRRDCQKRKTLNYRPNPHDKPPCPVPTCKGALYEIKADRLKDTGNTVCKCDGVCGDRGPMPHKRGQRFRDMQCNYYHEERTKKSLTKGTHTHSPVKRAEVLRQEQAEYFANDPGHDDGD